MITYSTMKMINISPRIICTLIIVTILFTTSCSGTPNTGNSDSNLSSDNEEKSIKADGLTNINISLITTDISVGSNRIAFALVEEEKNTLIRKENVSIQLVRIDSTSFWDNNEVKTLGESISATSQLAEIDRGYSHLHDDGSTHFHDSGSIHVYISEIMIPKAGDWLIQIGSINESEDINIYPALIRVREKSLSPIIGSNAPLSKQLLLEDVKDIYEIDTSSPPNPAMHKVSINEAIKNNMPTVIVFASPGFCISLTCGTTKILVDNLYEKYNASADFIHIEPYDLDKARNNQGLIPVSVMHDWGLQSEPWVFFVDSNGKISSKFEGIVTQSELETAFGSIRNDMVK